MTLAFVPGPLEIGIIVFVILLLFGAKLIPYWAKSLGATVKETRKIANQLTNEDEEK